MQQIQSLMDPNNKEQSFQDSLMKEEEVIGDTPMLVAETPYIDVIHLEEERMFENAKMFADRGNGCFTTKELLFICLLHLM
jgi:hypothetical protein